MRCSQCRQKNTSGALRCSNCYSPLSTSGAVFDRSHKPTIVKKFADFVHSVEDVFSDESAFAATRCEKCKEYNNPGFSVCWNCKTRLPKAQPMQQSIKSKESFFWRVLSWIIVPKYNRKYTRFDRAMGLAFGAAYLIFVIQVYGFGKSPGALGWIMIVPIFLLSGEVPNGFALMHVIIHSFAFLLWANIGGWLSWAFITSLLIKPK